MTNSLYNGCNKIVYLSINYLNNEILKKFAASFYDFKQPNIRKLDRNNYVAVVLIKTI